MESGPVAIHRDVKDLLPPGPLRLLLVGANHVTASLDLRETLARRATDARLEAAGGLHTPWSEVLLLKTCNRIEVYATTFSLDRAGRAIARALHLPIDSPSLYVLHDEEAAEHLLRVSSGLDSVAQGESQIAAQVTRAVSGRVGAEGRESRLATLFVQSVHAAQRIRRHAGLDRQPRSASLAAVRWMERLVALERPRIVLLGTGKMARIAAKALRGRGSVTVLGRTPRPSRNRTSSRQGRLDAFADLEPALVRADVVLAATASPKRLVTFELLRDAIAKRKGRPLWIVDLGFPRNVDPRCRELPGISLVDIDGLAPWGARPLPPAARARAETCIREEATRVLASLRSAPETDVVRFRKVVEALRRDEVERALARLPRLSEDDRAIVDKLATRLVNRFLHRPTERLRRLPGEDRARILRDLTESLGPTGRRSR